MRNLGVVVLLLAAAIQTQADAPAPTSAYLPKIGNWNLLFRQTINRKDEFFKKNEWTRNKDNAEAPNYSILADFENFRKPDGSFHLFLWYPELGKGNEWIQTSNPVTKTSAGVDNYKAISISYTGKGWGGLEYNNGDALLDGSVKSANWWYAIGSFSLYRGGIPGPAFIVKKVELYIDYQAPINGEWSPWSAYSPCSVSCDDGIRTRVRTCTNPPPSNGGKTCPGSDQQNYKCILKQCLPGNCEDGKPDPVDTAKNWPSKTYSSYSCFDVNGNSYKRGESLESCCGCFKFTCSYIYEMGFYNFFWTKFRHDSCCQDCEGTVFPAGSIMKSVELDDACNTTKKMECVYISQEKKAVIQESSTYKDCCSNSSGVYLKGTSMLVPATCSIEKCDRSPGRQEAAWIYTQELAGCNCCVYNGSLVNDGGWVILDDGKNATCCDGKLVVGVENTVTFPDEKCFLEDTNITFHDLGKNINGQTTKPVWIIDQGGRRLIETENTRPSVGLSNLGDPTKPVSFSGRVFSNDSDNDVIGMVFGYQNETNFFVVASAGNNGSNHEHGPTNWYIGRLHATCGTSCAETRTISDAIWDPASHPEDITILSSGTNYWSYLNIYRFSICFNPPKLLLSTTVLEKKGDSEVPVFDTGTISAKTGKQDVDDMSKLGGFVGVYVDSQKLTTWDQLDCADCDLTG